MLNIIIVDDEVLIREGLAKMISKESPCFQVIGQFSDGQEVLKQLPELDADIVITDIRMPAVDGLELIKCLRATHPHIRSILMSGFTDFDYAREAIRASAVDYLLKPINKEQLFELLYRLHDEREAAREQEVVKRRKLIHTCLHSDIIPEYMWEEIVLPLPYYVMFVQKGAHQETEQRFIQYLNKEQPQMILDRLSIHHPYLVHVLYLPEAPEDKQVNQLGQILAGIASSADIDSRIHAGSSLVYSDACMLKSAYSEAKRACDMGIYADSLHYYGGYKKLDRVIESPIEKTAASDWELFLEQLQLLHIRFLQSWIQQRFEYLQSVCASPEAIVEACRLIEDTAALEILELKVIFDSATHSGWKEALPACLSFSEMKRLFLSSFTGAISEVQAARQELGSKAVELVKRWIAENYNQHIELNRLASIVFLTPSYLSKLFRQETGLTLTEYITEIRLKHAKRLLRDAPSMKIHQIGAEVGYLDPAHFNKLFKRIVGVTPNEYKKLIDHH